jgi:hypothetical protein
MHHPAHAREFVLPQWEPAFEAIEDESPTVLAGFASTVKVTHVFYTKKRFGDGLKANKVRGDAAEDAYYLGHKRGTPRRTEAANSLFVASGRLLRGRADFRLLRSA